MKKTIVNIVASTDVGQKLNLLTIVKSFKNCEYEPEMYFALIYRLENPKISILINHSGKVIFNGSRKIENIFIAKEILFSELKKIGYRPIENEIKIHNIVVLVDLEKKIKLALNQVIPSTLTILQKKKHVIIKNSNPKFSTIIYPTGKCLIVGSKKIDQIDSLIEQLNNWVDTFFIEIN